MHGKKTVLCMKLLIFAMEIGWAKWTFTKLKGILYVGLGIAELQSSNGPVFKSHKSIQKYLVFT